MSKAYLYLSGDMEANEAACESLDKVPGLELRIVQDGAILEGKINLPFLQTQEGYRHLGLEGIKTYVRRKEAGEAPNILAKA